MCGLAGFFDPAVGSGEAGPLLEGMLESIRHRGPDARGTCSDGNLHLGHNRLSIIDLSADANQPLRYGNLVILHNGEVYNYLEIRADLEKAGHRFRTQSDTEVIGAAYSQWGASCVERFVGMWVFVVFDPDRRTLFVSRDRFGIKPLYYTWDGEALYFASEYKPLKRSPRFRDDLNIAQVARGLQLGWVGYGDETYYSRIKALPAAHNLTLDLASARLKIDRYWDAETGAVDERPLQDRVEGFRALFSESVRWHMRSDVPVASCLSGGIDSSAIVSMVQHLYPGKPYKAFSIYYEGQGDVDERPFIREVIGKYPAVEPLYYSPSDDDIREHFHHALFHADVPCTGSSFISQYFLMKLIGDAGIKVVLDGQGSDEYLGGYMHTFYRLVADRLLHLRFGAAIGLTARINRQLGAPAGAAVVHGLKSLLSVMDDEQALYALEYRTYYPFLCDVSRLKPPFLLREVPGSRTDNFLYHLLFSTSLPSLLHYEDRNSMAFSVESRVPFLDHRLVEYAFRLPVEDKVRDTETKRVLRASLDGILPDAIRDRRDKKGFVTPGENKWLRGPLKHLLDADPGTTGFLNRKKCRKLLDAYRRGDNHNAVLVWRLAVLLYWMKEIHEKK